MICGPDVLDRCAEAEGVPQRTSLVRERPCHPEPAFSLVPHEAPLNPGVSGRGSLVTWPGR